MPCSDTVYFVNCHDNLVLIAHKTTLFKHSCMVGGARSTVAFRERALSHLIVVRIFASFEANLGGGQGC